MPPRPADRLAPADRDRERAKYQARLATALSEEDDPLAVYHQFVQWTIKNYGETDPASGLKDLLKEATNQFKDDATYKSDLRYLKLWALAARQLDQAGAIAIYAYLVANDIGTTYSALYEDYANLLEAGARRKEADGVYRRGIKKAARPLERLKKRYAEFQSRGASGAASGSSSSIPASGSSSSKASTSRSTSSSSKPTTASASASTPTSAPTTTTPTDTFNSTAESRYALMLAPPAPGKRPEKLRFNMGLLWTDDGVEYSIQEARARSMGLLGKKWGPPPASEARFAHTTAMVDFNDDGQKTSRGRFGGRRSLMGGAEPTVTINTKEALADVFGMYNSPDRTTKLPGSKHAPIKKIEPVTPAMTPRLTFIKDNENAMSQNAKTPTPAFRPFSDENAQPATAARTPAAKFTPFVDGDQQKTPFITPRPVLTVKEVLPTPSNRDHAQPNDRPDPTPVFAKVFTPANKSVPLAPLRDVFTDDHGKPMPKPKAPTHERAKSQHEALPPASENANARSLGAFTPFKDRDENARTPFKVFSRPTEDAAENASSAPASGAGAGTGAFEPKTPSAVFRPLGDKTPAFTPFKDAAPAFTPFVDKPPSEARPVLQPAPLREREPVRPVFSSAVVEIEDDEEEMAMHAQAHVPPGMHDDDDEQDRYADGAQEEYYEEEEEDIQMNGYAAGAPHHPPEEEELYDEGESYQAPLGGRFGAFNVMTPITERTFEFTSSTRGICTPSQKYGPVDTAQAEYEAVEAAQLLAAELRDDDDEDEEEEEGNGARGGRRPALEPLRLSSVPDLPRQPTHEVIVSAEERTGSLSLLDTLTLSAKFRPSNPCNPFDPAILAALMSRIPTDPHFYDLRALQSNLLGELQKFTKKSRKASGGSGSKSGQLEGGSFPVVLQGHKFLVTEKVGEGGFGSVFKARDVGMSTPGDASDEEEDEDEDDEDEESASMVALKVVKPRNVWEYHVLRRLHTALTPSFRRSVVLPHALYAFGDESHLVLDLCPQGMLLNIVNNAGPAGVSQAGACLDELLVMFFSIELLGLLEAMHNAGFIHGDLKIDNLLLRLEEVPGGAAGWSPTYQPSGEGGWSYKGLKVIDFGRTIDMRLFPPGQQFVADWTTDDRDCIEVREGRPWSYQADYYGLAGVVYCMLFGKYIQANSVAEFEDEEGHRRLKIATPFKRYWQTDIWTRLFDLLLNPCLARTDGELPVCDEMQELRKEMEQWLQANCNRTSNTLKGLLKKVELSCYKL